MKPLTIAVFSVSGFLLIYAMINDPRPIIILVGSVSLYLSGYYLHSIKKKRKRF